MKSFGEQAIEILEKTSDGDALDPKDLRLLELAVNGHLSEAGEVAFASLYANAVTNAPYSKPWFHDIEHLTRDHEGYVYWRGTNVEHFSFKNFDRERAAAENLAGACISLEQNSIPVTFSNIIKYYERAHDSNRSQTLG